MVPNYKLEMMRKISMRNNDVDIEGDASQSDVQPQPDLDNIQHAEPLNVVRDEDVRVSSKVDHGKGVRSSKESPPSQKRSTDVDTSTKRKGSDPPLTKKVAKKPKENKKSKHKVSVKDVIMDEAFLKMSYEEWCKDPIVACAQVMMQVAEANKVKRNEYEKRAQDMLDVEKQKNFETLQELTAKYTALQKAKFDLEIAKTGRRDAETARDAALTQAKEAETKVKELQERVKELEVAEAAAKEKVESLEKEVTELEGRLGKIAEGVNKGGSDPDAKIAALQTQLVRTQNALKAS